MAIRKVAHLGHPVLRQMAAPVSAGALRSPEVQQLIDDMLETMAEYDGAGLAAPQVHVSQRIVIYGVSENPRYPDAEEVPLTILVNPVVTPLTRDEVEDWEGCLSVPGMRGRVPRATAVHVRALDRTGAPIDFSASDFHARVIQHECDHLDGKVYLDRMRSLESLSFLTEFRRYGSDGND